MRRLCRRLLRLRSIGDLERSMDREMRDHIQFETEDRIRRGMAPEEARASAIRDFGGVERFKEEGRDSRGTRGVEDLARDLRLAARVPRRHPAFAVTAVLTFALGIGATTAIVSVTYGVLMRPLPYAEPDELVVLWERNVKRGNRPNVVSIPVFKAWRERARSFEAMAAVVPAPVTVPAGDATERISGADVSPEYFGMLGVAPALGRDFTQADAEAGGRVVILSDAYWRRRFGADPGVVNRPLRVGSDTYTIIGVMPAGFEPPAFHWLGDQALWMPLLVTPDRDFGRYLLVVARLREQVGEGEARAEMIELARQLEGERPSNRGWSAALVPLDEQISGHLRTPFSYLLGAVGLLLALTVLNVGTLIITQTRRRLAEFGVRRALGADGRRIFRQIVIECLALGVAGCAAGLLLAFPATHFLVSMLPPDVPRQPSIRLDGVVLSVTVGVSLAASLIFATVSARIGRSAPSALLREGSARVTRRSTGRALVIIEVAIGLLLAVLAGLSVRSLAALRAVDLGFDSANVAIGRVPLGARYPTEEARRLFLDEFLVRLRARGIADAGIVSLRPLGGVGPATAVSRDLGPEAAPITADARWADAGFFRVLGIPVVEGSNFDESDGPGRPVRVLINQAMARALWPAGKSIGKTVHVNMYNGLRPTVAGVVRDVHLFDPRTPPRPAFYLSAHRFTGEIFDVVAPGGPATIATMRQTLADLDPLVPLHRTETMDALEASTVARDRFVAWLLSSFALLAAGLAAVGIYGVFASDVLERRREMGIRMALGAQRSAMMAMVLKGSLVMAVLGIIAGALAGLLAARWMRSLLFGVQATDAVSFAIPAFGLLVVAFVATLIPALQATRVSPLTVLRGE